METVTVTRRIPAAPDEIRAWMADTEAFMRAAGFTEVDVAGDVIRIANAVGLLRIELELEVIDHRDAALAYEQREGIFETMTTEYTIQHGDEDDESTVTATTTFALDVSVVGPIFDATVVKRQRRLELEKQLEYLASLAE